MNLLFTKTGIEQEVSAKLNDQFCCSFVDVLRTADLPVIPFDLGNHSLIFSSVHAVRSFFKNGFVPDEDFSHPLHFNKIYAVGLKTKKELRLHGFGTFKVFRHASELAEFIIENSSQEKFLHFCGNLALDVLDRALPLQNIFYRKITVYNTELLYPEVAANFDGICFFSPSGVRSFARFNSLENKMLFSIGETTEKELRKFTAAKIFTSRESNLADLLKLISETGGR